MVLKALTGRGMHVEQSTPRRSIPVYVPPKGGRGAPRMDIYRPPPYIGTWGNQVGMGKKSPPKREREKVYY